MSYVSARRGAGALYVTGVVAMCLRAGEPDQLWWWLGMIPFTAWIASPVLVGLYLHRRLEAEAARLLFGILLAVIAVVGFAFQWHTLFIGPSDAQNALVVLFAPLYQWFGVITGGALAWILEKALRA